MPSWANHFKVADKLYDKIHNMDCEYLLNHNSKSFEKFKELNGFLENYTNGIALSKSPIKRRI